MSEEKNLNLKIIPPKESLPQFAAAVAVVLIIFLTILSVSAGVGIANKIKEGRYIGQGAQYKNIISVSGVGKVLAAPDIAQVNLSVISNAASVVAAAKDNTDKMNKINQALKDIGIAADDLKTVAYNISPNYQYSAGKNIIIGYQVDQTLQVKIRNLDQVGVILEKSTSLGANQVGSLNFTFDDPEKLKDEARQKAIIDAKRKANDLASALNVGLGRIISFSENSVSPPAPAYYNYAVEGRGGGGGAAPDIQTGQNEIEVNVAINYEIY